ncbi:hypothetical protein [Brevibacillus brevis]|uniref:hypothetical protein n=1 Tax=Brevibacillus brevis TaxID=1393 RepID=UPI001EDAA64E|nr:hypothetical protein [Brevibacillus brevis]UKL00599.1 hypothetical protein FO446_25690 [Brevibacillus brevis]
MKELLNMLELKQAELLVRERMLRNSDTSHPVNAHNLEQVRNRVKSLQIQIDMIDVLRSVENEFSKRERTDSSATKQTEAVERHSSNIVEPFGSQR